MILLAVIAGTADATATDVARRLHMECPPAEEFGKAVAAEGFTTSVPT